MNKFMRILLLAFFILTVSVTPLMAKPGHGHGWGQGIGGGRGHSWGEGCGAPEIDPSLAPSAIALLSGGLLILRSRFGKKSK
jgi:hypothetical protein